MQTWLDCSCGLEELVQEENNVFPTFLVCDSEMISYNNVPNIVEKYFTYEDFGTQAMKIKEESLNDRKSRVILADTTRRMNSGYEVGFLWKEKILHFHSTTIWRYEDLDLLK